MINTSSLRIFSLNATYNSPSLNFLKSTYPKGISRYCATPSANFGFEFPVNIFITIFAGG